MNFGAFSFIGAVLVTDATAPMGLPPGIYPLGCQTVEVKNNRAVIAGTDLLCGRYCHCVTLHCEGT